MEPFLVFMQDQGEVASFVSENGVQSQIQTFECGLRHGWFGVCIGQYNDTSFAEYKDL